MKRILSLFLTLIMLLPLLISCADGKSRDKEIAEKNEEDGEYNILILGDDLMDQSKAYEYFNKFCKANDKDVVVEHRTEKDARLYTFADLCESDKGFAEQVSKAEMIIFEEGTAETATTVESLERILEYANDPITVNVNFYGYQKRFYKSIFKEKFKDMQYADADYYVKSIIASDEYILGYEHLYMDDRIHPNRLCGYLTAIVIYCEVFNATPKVMNFESFEYDKKLLSCVPEEWQGREDELWDKLHEMLIDLM
ncbi:MAG: hypothetical protein E7652_07340 [Ruminococcaceae bacterium]|nr:hypothetical protein [Oscillospiraceae bacterium]